MENLEYGMYRTEENVNQILHHAKLDRSDLLPLVQCLHFVPNMDNESIRLLEVDKHVLESLQTGQKAVIRGEKTDCAVLCTEEKTYEIREAETSNNLLLLPEFSFSQDIKKDNETDLLHRQVSGMKQTYFEIRPIRPRLKRIKQLLEKNKYSGREYEEDENHQDKKFTFDELGSLVQGSDAELKKGLIDVCACEIEGYCRMLDFDFRGKVLESILSLVDEQSWELGNIPHKETCDILEDLYPRSVIMLILDIFSNGDAVQTRENDSEIGCKVCLSEDKLCRYFAEDLLEKIHQFKLSEFFNVWQQSVPEGMKTGPHQLEGLALIDYDSKPQVIDYFPVHDLPEEIDERFNKLFKTRSKWTRETIEPYLRDLAKDEKEIGVLLTKYARASNQNGIKMYSSKRPLT